MREAGPHAVRQGQTTRARKDRGEGGSRSTGDQGPWLRGHGVVWEFDSINELFATIMGLYKRKKHNSETF